LTYCSEPCKIKDKSLPKNWSAIKYEKPIENFSKKKMLNNHKYNVMKSNIDLYNWTGNQLEEIKAEMLKVECSNITSKKRNSSHIFDNRNDDNSIQPIIKINYQHKLSKSTIFSNSHKDPEPIHTGKKIFHSNVLCTSNDKLYIYKPSIKTSFSNKIISNVSNNLQSKDKTETIISLKKKLLPVPKGNKTSNDNPFYKPKYMNNTSLNKVANSFAY
jgi:hypothetical protein